MYSLENLLKSLQNESSSHEVSTTLTGVIPATYDLSNLLNSGSLDVSRIADTLGSKKKETSNAILNIIEPFNPAAASVIPSPAIEGWTTYFTNVKAKKILLVSTHGQAFTGYAKVAWNIVKLLSRYPEFEVYQYAIHKYNKAAEEFRPYPENIKVFDVASEDKTGDMTGFCFDGLTDYCNQVKPDVIVIYNDAYIIKRYVDSINRCTADVRSRLKISAYLDQTYLNIRSEYQSFFNKEIDQIFVFNNEWANLLRLQGIRKPICVFEHGFDMDLHLCMDKTVARLSLSLPEDSFLIVAINRNCMRKRFDIVIAAFAELVCRHPNKKLQLFCVTDKGDKGGYSLLDIFITELRRRNVPIEQHIHKILMIAEEQTHSDQTINLIYNTADIGISCADAEGFSLSQFEMMGLGRPQVLTSHVAFSSYATQHNSMIVPTKYTYYVPNCISPVAGEAAAVMWQDVVIALERYVMDSELVERHGLAARERILKSTWDSVSVDFLNHLREL